jgi:hypothetical protein
MEAAANGRKFSGVTGRASRGAKSAANNLPTADTEAEG